MEDELVPLAVDQLLLGWNSTQKPYYNDEEELIMLASAKEFRRQRGNAWRATWKMLDYPYLLPSYSWVDSKKYINLEKSNTCQLKYACKTPKYYQFYIVMKTLLSKDGMDYTIIVAFNNHCAESTQSPAEDEMEVGAWKLSLILPVSGRTMRSVHE